MIINGLQTLGRNVEEKEQVAKILRSLTPKFNKNITAMEESSNIQTLLVEDLIGNLETIEV